MTKTVTLFLARSTTGTHVYSEPNGLPRAQQTFPVIYVQRGALPATPPNEIKVTVEFKE